MKMQQCPNGHFYDMALYGACPYCSPANEGVDRTLPMDDTWVGSQVPQTTSGFDQDFADDLGVGAARNDAIGKTVPLQSAFDGGKEDDLGKTVPIGPGGQPITPSAGQDRAKSLHYGDTVDRGAIGRTVPVINAFDGRPEDDGKTHPIQPNGAPRPMNARQQEASLVVGWLACCKGNDKGRDYRIENGNNTIGRGGKVMISIEHDETISREEMALVAYDDRANTFYLIAGTGKNVVRLNDRLLPASQSRELQAFDRIELGQTMLVFVPLCCDSFQWTE